MDDDLHYILTKGLMRPFSSPYHPAVYGLSALQRHFVSIGKSVHHVIVNTYQDNDKRLRYSVPFLYDWKIDAQVSVSVSMSPCWRSITRPNATARIVSMVKEPWVLHACTSAARELAEPIRFQNAVT